MLDMGNMFNSEQPVVEEEVPIDETFVAEYKVTYELSNDDRIENPSIFKLKLETNIPSEQEANYTLDDISMTLYQNGEVFQILNGDKLIKSSSITLVDNLIHVDYELNLDYYALELNRDGFFDAEFAFGQDKQVDKKTYQLSYRPEIEYVDNGTPQNNGNFIYKAFFKNEAGTELVPTYFSVAYPESITVEVRNRLYNPPPLGHGLSTEEVIPQKSSISKLGDKYYGVFMTSAEINKVIETKEEAQMAIDALVMSLTRLPNIDRLAFFVDEAQTPSSLFDIDLTQVYETTDKTYVYLSEKNSTTKRYLVPVEISEENVYDEILSIFNVLKTGSINDKQWMQIVPPNVEMTTFLIEGTTITADFNQAFLEAYDNLPEYRRLMINAILYSFTSHPNISKVKITVEGQPVTDYAGYDFTEAQLEPSYINFIGDY